jgi:hypothetical protein
LQTGRKLAAIFRNTLKILECLNKTTKIIHFRLLLY